MRSTVVSLALLFLFVGCQNGATREEVDQLRKQNEDLTKAVADLRQELQMARTQAVTAPVMSPPSAVAVPTPATPVSPEKFGYLTVHTIPPTAMATLMINGRPWAKATPFDDEKIPVGTYSVQIRNEGLGWEKTLQVQIIENRRIVLESVNLRP